MWSAAGAGPEEQGNIKKFAAMQMLTDGGGTLIALPLVQLFAISRGVREGQLGLLGLCSSLAAALGYLASMERANRMPEGRLVRANQLLQLHLLIAPAALCLLCVFGGAMGAGAVLLVLIFSMAGANFVFSYYTLVMTRLQWHLFSPRILGRVFGISGFASNVVCVAASAGIKPVLAAAGGAAGFLAIFGLAFLLRAGVFFAASGFVVTQKSGGGLQRSGPAALPELFSSLVSDLRDRRTLLLALIHILRGMSDGAVFFLVPAGLQYYALRDSDAGYVSLLLTTSCLAANAFIYRRFDRIGAHRSCRLALMLEIAALLLLLPLRSRLPFFLLYFCYSLGNLTLASALPLGVLHVTAPERIASVTALRMLALQLASALTTGLLGAFVIRWFSFVILAVCLLKTAKALLIRALFRERGGWAAGGAGAGR
jgi:hypothetical protein